MNELERIQDQIIRSLDGAPGEAWHGPAIMEVLSGVDAQTAAARPIPNAHTIWKLILHLSASAGLVLAHSLPWCAPGLPVHATRCSGSRAVLDLVFRALCESHPRVSAS